MKMHKHLKEKRERLKGWNLDFLMKYLSRNEMEIWVEIIQSKVEDEYYKGIKHKKINNKSKNFKLKNKNKLNNQNIDYKNTEYKIDDKNRNYIKCPKCSSEDLSKNGITNNRQRYICKNCRITFDERSFSPLSNTKLSLDKWLKYCAEKVDVSIPTSFFMRHRILDILNLAFRNQIFEGLVAVDDYNLNESFKGKSYKKSIDEDRYFYNFQYRDLSRCVGWTFRNTSNSAKHPERGIKSIQVKINTAIDKKGHILTRIIENPYFELENNRKNNVKNEIYQLEKSRIPQIEDEVRYKMENMQKYKYNKVKKKIKCQDVISFFDGRLGENVTLCAFNSRLYREVARKLNVKFKKSKSRMSEPVYSVKHVFMHHIKLSKWLENFNGVATKYLNNYLAWYSFLSIMKEINNIKILNKLFIEITTKQLYMTKRLIQDRYIEVI